MFKIVKSLLLIASPLIFISACNEVEPASKPSEPTIEYIAHASFRISDGNNAVVIDPFNSRIWLGYSYPKTLSADAVLITHPHFDHDASYYFSNTPTYRDPDTFMVGNISVQGIPSEHDGAVEMKKRGGNAMNTVWIIELEGKRIVHLGDTRPLTNEEIAAIGRVDIILTNLVEQSEIERMISALQASTVIPMHYKLPIIAPDGGNGLDTIDEWSTDTTLITRLPDNTVSLDALPSGFVTLKPMDKISAWPDTYAQTSEIFKAARAATQATPPDWEKAEIVLKTGLEIDPGNISIYQYLAHIYRMQENEQLRAETLELGLKNATDLDWSAASRSHNDLLTLYKELGQNELAKPHEDWLAQNPSSYYIAR